MFNTFQLYVCNRTQFEDDENSEAKKLGFRVGIMRYFIAVTDEYKL